MKTTQHTPLPWRIADSSTIWSGDQPVCTIAHEENSNLSAEEADANQRFIVTACNSHYELLEALRRFVSLCPSAEGLGGHAPMGSFNIAADYARKAIQSAQEKE